MRIAFDIDDVIAKWTYKMVQNGVIYDQQVAKSKKGIVDINKWVTHGMFDWTREECTDFNNRSIHTVYQTQRPNYGGKQAINMLRKYGHEIYFVTARGLDGQSNRKTTTRWLAEQGIKYDKLFFKVKDKMKVLLENHVDIFLDDGFDNCEAADKAGIFTIQICDFSSRHRKFKRQINSWQEVFDCILKRAGQKPLIEQHKIIVDSDVTDEIDDEFALAYLFSFEKADIAAVTIAPHFQLREDARDCVISENVKRSFEKAVQIAHLARPQLVDKIFKGDTVFMGFGQQEVSEAVKKIIEICKQNDKITFIELGAPVNLAHALRLAPEIADKIELYALMGELVPNALAPEHNMSQDFLSTKVVFEKIKNKHIFPATGFSNLLFTLDDLKIRSYGQKNAVLDLLKSDFSAVMKEKFANHRYKSIFDVVVPYYLAHPIDFIETKSSIKLNNNHVLFEKSKNFAYFPTNIFPEKPIKDFYARMKKFDLSKAKADKKTSKTKKERK